MNGLRNAAFGLGLLLLGPSGLRGGAAARVSIAQPGSWVKLDEKPDYGSPASIDATKGFDILLADDQFCVEDQSRYTRLAYRITSALGSQNGSSVSVLYDPEYESIEFHQVHIVRDGQVLDRLDLGQIRSIQQEKDLERNQYNGQLTALLLLDDVRVGDVVDYSYTRRGANPVMAGHFCRQALVARSIPVHRERVRLVTSRSHTIYSRISGNAALTESTTTLGDQVEFVWRGNQLPAVEPDPDLPYGFEPYAYIELSDFSDWRGVADWARPLYRMPDPIPAAVAEKAQKVAAGCDTDERKALAVLHFVQEEIRYLGIEIGIHSHVPNPPELVLERRYGDCKDKVMLFCAMLSSLGVPADPALTHTYRGGSLADHEATSLVFNHVIAKVQADGFDSWVDPTLTDQSGDLAHRSVPPYAWALRLKDGTDSLDPVRPDPEGKSSMEVHETYTLGTDGKPATLDVAGTYCGGWADSMRSYLKHATADQLTKDGLNFRSRLYPKIRVAVAPTWSDWEKQDRIFTHSTYTIDDMWQAASNGTRQKRAEFYPMAMRDFLFAPESPHRSMPMYLAYPLDITYTAEIISPYSGAVNTSGEKVDLEKYFSATASCSGGKNTTTLRFTLSHGADQIPAARVADYAEKLREFRQAVSYQITIDPEAIERGLHFRLNWVLASSLLASAAVSLLGAWFLARQPYRIPAPGGGPASALEGIDGWLLLVGFGVFIRPSVLLFQFVKLFWRLIDYRVWAAFTLPTSIVYRPGFGPIALGEAVADVAMVAAEILTIILFLKRRWYFPRMFISVLVAGMVILLVDHTVSSQVLQSDTAEAASKFGTRMGQSLIASMIWIPYMLVSKRVKATFVT